MSPKSFAVADNEEAAKRDVIVVCPLRPAKSGIADYFEDLTAAHAAHWRVHSVVEFRDHVRDARKFSSIASLIDANIPAHWPVLTHIGNNPDHLFAFHFARRHPSIVVLHDYNLHHVIAHATLARGDKHAYRDYLTDQYGALGERVAAQRDNWAFSDFQQFLMPINRPVLLRARGVIVHSRWAAAELQHAEPGLKIRVVPHFWSPAEESRLSQDEAKFSFGIPPGKVVIGAIGFVTPPKQVDLLLKAAATLPPSMPEWTILIAGEAAEPTKLNTLIEQLGLRERVVTTGYLPTERFKDAIAACDVVSNLRYPSAGETSGVLVKAMGAGKCCLVFRYGSFVDFPAETVVPVPIETQDATPLASYLHRCIAGNGYRDSVATRAADYIRERHSAELCARQYEEFVREIYDPATPLESKELGRTAHG